MQKIIMQYITHTSSQSPILQAYERCDSVNIHKPGSVLLSYTEYGLLKDLVHTVSCKLRDLKIEHQKLFKACESE